MMSAKLLAQRDGELEEQASRHMSVGPHTDSGEHMKEVCSSTEGRSLSGTLDRRQKPYRHVSCCPRDVCKQQLRQQSTWTQALYGLYMAYLPMKVPYLQRTLPPQSSLRKGQEWPFTYNKV